jgi:hypothetical protein
MTSSPEPKTTDHCNICFKPSWGFSIMGAMPWEKPLNPYVYVCLDCCDTAPCGSKGHYNNGELTCPHGFIYTKSADWIVNGKQATLKWKIVGRTWTRTIKKWLGFETLTVLLDHQ